MAVFNRTHYTYLLERRSSESKLFKCGTALNRCSASAVWQTAVAEDEALSHTPRQADISVDFVTNVTELF
jgi:hypothetical protein